MEKKEEQEIILLIMNCKKYNKKALFQKRTWLALIPNYIKFYHVIGEENLETNYLFDNKNKILWVKTPDDYNSLPKKVYESLNAVNEMFDYKYLFKTDDDQILVNSKFFDVITSLIKVKNPTPHYGGYVVDVKKTHYSKYKMYHPELPDKLIILKTKYCSGRFYFLSKYAVENILSKKGKIYSEYLEDYAIGYHLDQQFKEGILNIATNKFFTDIENSDFPKWLEKKII